MSQPDATDLKALDRQVERICQSTALNASGTLQSLLKLFVNNWKSQRDPDSGEIIKGLWPGEKGKDEHNLIVTRGRLRDALDDYYSKEGINDLILIKVPLTPPGGRRTKWIEVLTREFAPPSPEPTPPEPEPPPPPIPERTWSPPPRRWTLFLALGGLAVLGVLIGGVLLTKLHITKPADGGRVSPTPLIEGRGGLPWRRYYLVVEDVDTGAQYAQYDLGPLSHGPLLGWSRQVHVGAVNTRPGSWFYVYAIATSDELRGTKDYDPATGRLVRLVARPDHAISVQLQK